MKPKSFCAILSFLLIYLGIQSFPCYAEGDNDPSRLFKKQGIEYLRAEKYELAIHAYEKAVQIDSKSTASLFNLAIAYYGIRNITGAVHALEKLIEIEPNDVEAHYNLACLKLYGQDFKNAKVHFEKARECCNKNPEFKPLIDEGLEFLDHLQKNEPATQDLVSFFLAQGLPSIVVGG